MFSKRNFVEVLALSTVVFCIWIPAGLWTFYSLKAGKLEELPGSLTGFMAAANAITLGLLGLQQFTTKPAAAPASPAP